mgnify:CR=1 FL=1
MKTSRLLADQSFSVSPALGCHFIKRFSILPTTALELEPGKRASTVWLHARLERDSDGDLGTTKAGFENIAEAEKVFLMIRDLQGKAVLEMPNASGSDKKTPTPMTTAAARTAKPIFHQL